MGLDDFALGKKNCYVMENGFLFWKITPDERFRDCVLSGEGKQMVMHLMVVEGDLTVCEGTNTYALINGSYAHLADCSAVKFVAASSDCVAYVAVFLDSYVSVLLRDNPLVPLSLVLMLRDHPLERLSPAETELLASRMEAIKDACKGESHVYRDSLLRHAIWMHVMDVVNIYMRQEKKDVPADDGREEDMSVTFIDLP